MASQDARKTRVTGCLGCLGALAVFLAALVALHFVLLDGLDGILLAFILREDTVYAPRYSERGFRAVKPGMTASEVERLLGAPLRQADGHGGASWEFTQGNFYRVRRILFDRNGRVVQKVCEFYLD